MRYLTLVLTIVVAALCASVVFAIGMEVGGPLAVATGLLSVAVWLVAYALGTSWSGPARTS